MPETTVSQGKRFLDDPRRVVGLVAIAAMAGFLIGYRFAGGQPPTPAPGMLPADSPFRVPPQYQQVPVVECAKCREDRIKAAYPARPTDAPTAPAAPPDNSEAPFDHARPAHGPVVPKDTPVGGVSE